MCLVVLHDFGIPVAAGDSNILRLPWVFAGGLDDNPAGRREYRDYLGWLSETDSEKKRLGFEEMPHGWVKGTREFKRAVLEGVEDLQIQKVVEAEAAEMREPR